MSEQFCIHRMHETCNYILTKFRRGGGDDDSPSVSASRSSISSSAYQIHCTEQQPQMTNDFHAAIITDEVQTAFLICSKHFLPTRIVEHLY